jgi:hypothetical protein
MQYRYITNSVEGFIQQLAGRYLADGYWFYKSGRIAQRRDVGDVDRMFLRQYGIGASRISRQRRQAVGIASMHYLRCERFYVLLATEGHHPFYDNEQDIRDARRVSIRFGGYSVRVDRSIESLVGIRCRTSDQQGDWQVFVEIEPRLFVATRRRLVEMACESSTIELEQEFSRLPFQPYRPVQQQKLDILWKVNRVRKDVGLESVDPDCLRVRRRIVRPFGPLDIENAA